MGYDDILTFERTVREHLTNQVLALDRGKDTSKSIKNSKPIVQPLVQISYAREDTLRIMPICTTLEARGFRIWYEHKNIHPGDSIVHEIFRAMELADFLSSFSFSKHGALPREIVNSLDIHQAVKREAMRSPEIIIS